MVSINFRGTIHIKCKIDQSTTDAIAGAHCELGRPRKGIKFEATRRYFKQNKKKTDNPRGFAQPTVRDVVTLTPLIGVS